MIGSDTRDASRARTDPSRFAVLFTAETTIGAICAVNPFSAEAPRPRSGASGSFDDGASIPRR